MTHSMRLRFPNLNQ
ncbi:erythromycin resistance leader peptide [Lysinibacillus telephonicus]|uniref:Uncharacterized protein n=1 Tax=Lysinibacillus telephonicus TaxID=1714840 RepID=A0A3S0HKT4_9BACI|nr:hypothetical protein EKG35_04205 [Lysinibacillus telephonicus]